MPPLTYFGVRSPGHEGIGTVVKVGSAVTTFQPGELAGIKPILDVCHACSYCLAGKENYCRSAIHTGLMATGSYQQYVVAPARYTPKIPKDVDPFLAAPLMCSATTMFRSLQDSGLRAGDWAVFVGGGGGVGIQGVQLAKILGLRPIVVDGGVVKRRLANKMGAEAFVDFTEHADSQAVAAEVTKIADGVGPHGVFVTAAAAYADVMGLVGHRSGAVIMCVGLPPDGAPGVAVDPYVAAVRNLTVKGTLVGTLEDSVRVVEFARRGLLKHVCEVVPLDKLPEAVNKLKDGKVPGRIVVDFES